MEKNNPHYIYPETLLKDLFKPISVYEYMDKGDKDELENIGVNQPVWDGDTLSHDTARGLVKRGLALYWNEEPCGYCLTEEGKKAFKELYPDKEIGGISK